MQFKNFSIIILCFSFTPTHAELNDTGIITCSNANQNGLSCPVANFPDQDAEYGTNKFDFTKLDANGNTLLPTVTNHTCVKDNITGLIWEVKTNDNGLRDKDWTYTWYSSTSGGTSNGGTCYTPGRCDTEKFVADVNARGLCGYNDWRLPNPQEFVSIVDYSITAPDPTIDTGYFPNTLPEWSWTSHWYAGASNQAWIVSFYSGIVYNKDRALKIPVRLVRGEQMPISSFIFSNNNATITDQATGLMWSKCAVGQNINDCSGNATDVSWETALNMAVNSTLADYSDWRLPNIKELQSLINYTKHNPSINSSFFPNAPNAASAKFWASSPGASAVSGNFVYSWGITFYDGNINAFDRSGNNGNSYVVLLVRDNNEQLFPLSITKTGSGTVTSDPAGINCGNDCSKNYARNTEVILTATPTTGSVFGGWSGECSGSINTCSVIMDATKNAAAIFDLIPLPIAITNNATNITKTSATLNGSIISASATATVNFRLGTTVDYGTDIIATPSQIYSSSAVAVSANTTGLTCNTDYNFCVKAVSSAGTSNCRNKIFKTATCSQPGVCGTANGSAVDTAPNTNLCSSGDASAVTGSGPWNWSCNGINGGISANCSANINRYTVTAYAGTGGTVSPSAATINYGNTVNFTVKANNVYNINSNVSSTCAAVGTWNAESSSTTSPRIWTTGPITNNCEVNFTFNPINSWLYPTNVNIPRDKLFTLNVTAKSNGMHITNYEFVITFDPNKLSLDFRQCGSVLSPVCPGTNALRNNQLYISSNSLKIVGLGGETVAGNDLQLLGIYFKSRITLGPTTVDLKTNTLVNTSGENIGSETRGAIINVSSGICGDANGDTVVNIIDALAIARYKINLPPPPTIEPAWANVDDDGQVTITDALHIARYSLGLVLLPKVCNIGQPL